MNKTIKRLIVLITLSLVLAACSPSDEERVLGDYHMLEVNLLHVDGGLFWAINTNTMTLGDELDRQNELSEEERDLTVELKETDEGRVIHEFDGMKNNRSHKWSIYSEDCENEVCSDDVDSIELNRDLNLMIVYEDRQ